MKSQIKWQPLLLAAILGFTGLMTGVAFADDDDPNYRHHGMMHQDRDKDDDRYERGSSWHHRDDSRGYSDHHMRGMHWGRDAWWTTLTDDQREAIKESKLQMRKERAKYIAELRVAKAELAQLSTEDNPNQARIDEKIDEVTQLINQLMKQHYAHRQEVRELLNDEQRIAYDTSLHGMRYGKHGWHH